MPNKTNVRFLVNKKQISNTRFVENLVNPLEEGEVLLRVRKYALTANNITYAVVGFRLQYWNFFPAEDSFGIIPVWGFAEIVDSRHDDLPIGATYYGYLPMSTYLQVLPVNVKDHGFSDGAAHRQPMAAIYNYYELVDKSKQQQFNTDYIPLIKPLFATSFLSYHFLKESDFFAGEVMILTSASSKTALALAFMFYREKKRDNQEVIGLTSEKNKAFVHGTALYDRVLTYEEIDQLPLKNTVLIDMAGKGQLINDIYGHLNENLKYASMIGLADWQADRSQIVFPNAKMFFAPSVFQAFGRQWGTVELTKQINSALADFIAIAKEWIQIQYIETPQGIAQVYGQLVNGKADPSKGYIVNLK